MNPREQVFAALRGEAPDIVPFVPKPNHLPRDFDKVDRLKKMGMGLSVPVDLFEVEYPNVRKETRVVDGYETTVFHTSIGEVSEKVRLDLPTEGGERDIPWRTEHLFKRFDDYKVIRLIIEDEVCKADFANAHKYEAMLGGDGVVYCGTGYSSLMQLVIRYMGFQRLAVELRRRPDQVEELLEAIDMKFEERVSIAANSPLELVSVCGNIDGVLLNPKLFDKYIISRFQRYNEILHRKGKITMCHMDGRLGCLKELIGETGLDVVQAFTPPPMGDLPLKEARAAWDEELAIWVNVPGVIFYYEPRELERFIRDLLIEASPGNGLVLGITETVPPAYRDAGLEIITKAVQKYGRYPIPAN